MEIKMPIKFHGNYVLSIRCGDSEARERCQKLTIRELSAEEKERSYEGLAEGEVPTHQVTFYDFGCKRIIEGKIKDNEKEKVVFKVKDKEYEFAPFVPRHD
ncbi:MAG: hypothetical protein ABFD62_05535 [Syntrophaceae bacterium]